jgi:hypothetical protein
MQYFVVGTLPQRHVERASPGARPNRWCARIWRYHRCFRAWLPPGEPAQGLGAGRVSGVYGMHRCRSSEVVSTFHARQAGS